MRELTKEEQEIATHLKASIWYTVSKCVEERTKQLSEESGSTVSATPQLVAALVELVYRQLTTVGEDLALFAGHAGRKTVTPEDMLMIVRRNPELAAILEGKPKEPERPQEDQKTAASRAVSSSQREDDFSDMGDYI